MTVTTNDSYNDHVQAYAAGLVEGYLTANYIYMNWMNTLGKYCADKTPFCLRLEAFLEININWMIGEVQKNPSDPYFHQVCTGVRGGGRELCGPAAP